MEIGVGKREGDVGIGRIGGVLHITINYLQSLRDFYKLSVVQFHMPTHALELELELILQQ